MKKLYGFFVTTSLCAAFLVAACGKDAPEVSEPQTQKTEFDVDALHQKDPTTTGAIVWEMDPTAEVSTAEAILLRFYKPKKVGDASDGQEAPVDLKRAQLSVTPSSISLVGDPVRVTKAGIGLYTEENLTTPAAAWLQKISSSGEQFISVMITRDDVTGTPVEGVPIRP